MDLVCVLELDYISHLSFVNILLCQIIISVERDSSFKQYSLFGQFSGRSPSTEVLGQTGKQRTFLVHLVCHQKKWTNSFSLIPSFWAFLNAELTNCTCSSAGRLKKRERTMKTPVSFQLASPTDSGVQCWNTQLIVPILHLSTASHLQKEDSTETGTWLWVRLVQVMQIHLMFTESNQFT